MAVSPQLRAEHTRRIRRAARKLERCRQAVEAAEQERQTAIREAFHAGLTATPIHQAAGISEKRAYQIKQGRR